jgi:hypothetical protein
MNRKYLIPLIIIILTIFLVILMKYQKFTPSESNILPPNLDKENSVLPTPTPVAAPAKKTEPSKAAKIIAAIYSASIDFYGKVEDQNGNPVAGATVHFSTIETLSGKGSEAKITSDQLGFFTRKNVRGAGVIVGVYKDGYAEISYKSSANFGIGMPADSTRKEPPTKDKPAVFVLRKMAKPEMMIGYHRCVMIKRGSNSVEIDLKNGEIVGAGLGDLIVDCWVSEIKKPNTQVPFDWRYRLSIPGGGFLERKDKIDHEAPEDGYQSPLVVEVLKTVKRWDDSYSNNYFVKLRTGNFARVNLSLRPSGDFIDLEVYLNPSGSRNLEYDENLDPTQR